MSPEIQHTMPQRQAVGPVAAHQHTKAASSRGAVDQGVTPAQAVVLVAAAALVLLVQLAGGVQMVGPLHAHDGSFAVAALRDFRADLAQGWLLPRWSMTGNNGLGSPTFYFYPPVAFAVAGLVARCWPAISDAGAIAVACALFRIGSLLSCAAWLRRHTGPTAAVLGGAVYALMPYVAFVNPQVRLAYAETAAGALLPLAFLAVDLGGGRMLRTIAWLAPAIAALALTHLPSTVIAGGLVVAYAAGSAPNWRGVVWSAAAACAATALGLCLAGVTIVPALLLLPFAHFDWLQTPFFRAENHLFFTGQKLHEGSTPAADLAWHVVAIVPAAIGGLCMLPGRRHLTRVRRAVGLTLAVAFFLITPASRPFYTYLPVLYRIQFPFRFTLPISLCGAVLLALALPLAGPRARRLAIAGCLVMAAAVAAAAWQRGDWAHSYAAATELALRDAVHDVAEYLPAHAPRAFWEAPRAAGAAAVTQAGFDASGCAAHQGLASAIAGGAMTVTLQGCAGRVVLPQFFFPGWVSDSGAVTYDPASGLLAVDVPAGTPQVTLRRVTLPEERWGWRLSLLGGAVWAVMLGALLRAAGTRSRMMRSIGWRRGWDSNPR